MLQNLTNFLKSTYFPQQPLPRTTPPPKPHHPKLRHLNLKSQLHKKCNTELLELCNLLKSDQPCENWIMVLEQYKDNYVVKYWLYNCVLEGAVNVHNLFLMVIQCRVLGDQVWLPIQVLCRLRGDRDNQLCCLIHYTVMNMGKKYPQTHNPKTWPTKKALTEMGQSFKHIYNPQPPNPPISLQQKIAILPMLILLNQKNSAVLWQQLDWLYTFPYAVMVNLRTNMRRLVEERVSQVASWGLIGDGGGGGGNDYFMSRMCVKSIQLLQVQGFVSAKNLFAYTYDLYNISLLLSLLSDYAPSPHQSNPDRVDSFRLQLIDFLLELFDCVQAYEYNFSSGDGGDGGNGGSQNNNDIANLRVIVVRNKLYVEELNNIRFNQEIQELIQQYESRQRTLASKLPMTSPKQKPQKKPKNPKKMSYQQQPPQTPKNSQQPQNQLHPNSQPFPFTIGKLQQATLNIQNWIKSKSFDYIRHGIMDSYQQEEQQVEQEEEEEDSRNQNSIGNTSLARVVSRCSSVQYHNKPQIFPKTNHNSQRHDYHDNNQQQLQPQTLSQLTCYQKPKKFTTHKPETILSHILYQLYRLKTDYLQLLHSILVDCHTCENYCHSSQTLYPEEPWTESSSTFHKLQLYLVKNFLLEFLVCNFNSIQSRDPVTMVCYYGVLGGLLRGNGVVYGWLDRIMIEMERDWGSNKNKKKQQPKPTPYSTRHPHPSPTIFPSRPPPRSLPDPLTHLTHSFTQNLPLTKQTILLLLSDQFEWVENEQEQYPNRSYESLLVRRVIEEGKVELMVRVVESVCMVSRIDQVEEVGEDGDGEGEGQGEYGEDREGVVGGSTGGGIFDDSLQLINNGERNHNPTESIPKKTNNPKQKPIDFQLQNSKYQWVTLLLALYYYYQQTSQTLHRNIQTTKNSAKNCNITLCPQVNHHRTQKSNRNCQYHQQDQYGQDQGRQQRKGNGKGSGSGEKEKISTPNKAYLDRLLEKERFMEELYHIRIPIVVGFQKKYQYRFEKPSKTQSCPSQNQMILQQPDLDPIIIPFLSPIVKKQRVLNILVRILDDWQNFYNKNSKKSIFKYSLNYTMLRLYKKKLRNRIVAFVRIREYEETGDLNCISTREKGYMRNHERHDRYM